MVNLLLEKQEHCVQRYFVSVMLKHIFHLNIDIGICAQTKQYLNLGVQMKVRLIILIRLGIDYGLSICGVIKNCFPRDSPVLFNETVFSLLSLKTFVRHVNVIIFDFKKTIASI